MPKYTAWVPVFASVEYELETDEPIEDPEALRQAMIDGGEPTGGSLCYHCSRKVEVDSTNADWDAWRDAGGEVTEAE